jgi:CheY-like chemotaxis protein
MRIDVNKMALGVPIIYIYVRKDVFKLIPYRKTIGNFMPKILLIEDSNFQRRILSKFLENNGHQVHEAANGKIGLEMVEEHQPDLIFCDLVMPETDGFGVLKALQEKKSVIPIVVLTSDIQKPVREQCIELGAAEFLNKPVNQDEIQNTLQKVFGSA